MARHHRNEIVIVKDPGFWARRSLMEKTLLILCIAGAIAITALIISLYLISDLHHHSAVKPQYRAEALRDAKDTNGELQTKFACDNLPPGTVATTINAQEDSVCVTKGCIQTTTRLLESLDESIDPCDNFYEFACGSFIKNTFIPDDKANVDSFTILTDKLQEQLRQIITEESKPDELRPFTLLKNLNKACLNKTIIEKRGNAPLLDLLNEYGGWPVVKGDEWIEAGWDWVDNIKRFRQAGLDTSIIFTLSVSTDLKNSTTRKIYMDQTNSELGRELLILGLDEKFVKAYYDFMVSMAVTLGAEKENAEKEMLDALNFEIALANISWPREERRNASRLYNPTTIKELQERYPYLQWLEYINALLPSDVQTDENEVVIVSVPSFFEKLGDVLQSVPKRTIANYFGWRNALSSSGSLTTQLFNLKLNFYTALSGQPEQQPRWKECVSFTATNLPIAVGALYVRKFFKDDARQAALKLVENLREEFMHVLHEVSWMDDKTKIAALEKAKAITNHIGYPDELGDDNKIEEFYRELDLEPDNLYNNTLKLAKFYADFELKRLREPVNKTEWIRHSRPASVSAAYSSLENSIQFSAAILQDKFFSPDRPHYMNYAAIGQVIGHEITHGFDDRGRQFDLDGNLAEWWDVETRTKFLDKAKCIIDQYAEFNEPHINLTLNGINTQGENIADNGGVKEAYNAYKKWTSENGPEKKLPGLKYTPEQLFWISAAQTWCAVSRDEYTKLKITSGVHSPNLFRVLGPISNSRDFSFDFNCPEGTKMNPTKKCEVW